ncbi:MAG: flagellar export protein FliJ [Desulfovibrionales bacterium]
MTKQFRFSLQKVLDYRFQMEDQARGELALALARKEEQQREVEKLEAAMRLHQDTYGQCCTRTQPELWLWSRYRDRLESEREEALKRLGVLTEQVESCRHKAIQCSRERKLLERLRSKKFLEHAGREQKQEQQNFDEMATIRHGHNNF